jgi:hypothetical protein
MFDLMARQEVMGTGPFWAGFLSHVDCGDYLQHSPTSTPMAIKAVT